MRAQLGFLRSEPGTPQFPCHLMSSQLGFLCRGTPAQSGKSGHQEMNDDTHVIGMFPGEDGERRTECQKVQRRHSLNGLSWKEVDIGLVGLGFHQILKDIQLQWNLVREGIRHPEGRLASGATQTQQSA